MFLSVVFMERLFAIVGIGHIRFADAAVRARLEEPVGVEDYSSAVEGDVGRARYAAEAHELGRSGFLRGDDVSYSLGVVGLGYRADFAFEVFIRHVEASDVDLRGVSYLDARGVGYEDVAAYRVELSVDFGYFPAVRGRS